MNTPEWYASSSWRSGESLTDFLYVDDGVYVEVEGLGRRADDCVPCCESITREVADRDCINSE